MTTCPHCQSDRVRRGGSTIWSVYMMLILGALAAVLVFELNAAIVGGIVLTAIVLSHLVLNQRVCLDCGQQWR